MLNNYRRLISYIYAYEGGVKGKNIGFAKIEMRGEQCRIQVNVKKVYVGSNDIGVYLLSPGTELLLGRIFIRNGSGEFRIHVNRNNVEGSGLNMDECYGLTIHDVESAWQCYTTIWDDAVTQAAETMLEDVTSSCIVQEKEQDNIEGRYKESSKSDELPISREIEQELMKEEMRLQMVAPWGEHSEPEIVPPSAEPERAPQPEIVPPSAEPERVPQPEIVPPSAEPERAPQPEREPQPEILPPPPQPELPPIPEDPALPPQPSNPEILPEPTVPPLLPQPEITPGPAPIQAEESSSVGPENLEQLRELDRLEQEQKSRNRLWEKFQNRYAKVLAFDYDKGCEILSIKPQDIGLLPRDIWVYGNNSFLLHGYYNYRHLILAKLNDPEGSPRYLLGVPGHYFSNEKYMASMFGFPHFVLARKQPEEDGRFGYWYTDIRL